MSRDLPRQGEGRRPWKGGLQHPDGSVRLRQGYGGQARPPYPETNQPGRFGYPFAN